MYCLHATDKFGTYGWSDSPAPHARDFKTSFLHLVVGQFDMKVELIVAGTDDDVAAFFRKIRDAGIKLDVAEVLQGLSQSDELWKQRGFMWMR